MNKKMNHYSPTRTISAIAAVAVATGIVVAGCSKAQAPAKPQAAVSHSAAVKRTAPAQPVVLTMAQARSTYARLVDSGNAASDNLNRAITDAAPWPVVSADLIAERVGTERLSASLAEYRWPASVQPYITAMRITDLAADQRCAAAMLAAGSQARLVEVDNTDPSCMAAEANANAAQIRVLLNLPALPE